MGGYHEGDPTNRRVMNAASFAVVALAQSQASAGVTYSFMPALLALKLNNVGDKVSIHGTELKIEVPKVRQQVVAGMNYDLTVELHKEESCLGAFEVKVYDRFGDLKVTKWGKEVICDESHQGPQV